ncbi:hypothetical protein [Arachidicoccus terrestris]|uniref:hypothetical protein n=1 Tax=Arachidicoccus terrestris TaxID=2875539 RepID=UPI001CC6632F|nr:hypothetical protein [Arachidicoccus terrestris]UAY54111.1 hypothetical protein K9M52_11595 [Arachidicoccus terrestris]
MVSGCREKKAHNLSYHLTMEMSETISDNKRTLSFNFWSNSLKEKAGFRLQNKVLKHQNKIKVNLYTAANTPPSNAPLETVANIDSLENGTYNITLRLKETQIPGKLIVDNNTYELNLEKNDLVTVKANKLNKIPLNSIFGSVHYYSPATVGIINGFLDALQESGARRQPYFPGNYGLFTVAGNGQIEQKNDSGYLYTKKFIYQYSGDEQKLKALVKKYSFDHTTELLITLRTYNGKLFNLWSFNQ